MATILVRKVALLLVLVPLLHLAGFWYAQRTFPQLLDSIGSAATNADKAILFRGSKTCVQFIFYFVYSFNYIISNIILMQKLYTSHLVCVRS
jgi:hypothetical protein